MRHARSIPVWSISRLLHVSMRLVSAGLYSYRAKSSCDAYGNSIDLLTIVFYFCTHDYKALLVAQSTTNYSGVCDDLHKMARLFFFFLCFAIFSLCQLFFSFFTVFFDSSPCTFFFFYFNYLSSFSPFFSIMFIFSFDV